MNRRLVLSPILAFALLGSTATPAVASIYVVSSGIVSADDDAAYTAGTKALNESRWADAVTAFDQVVNAKGKKADAALYWKAYALNKLDKQQLAADTCVQLSTQYKDSTWNGDCRALTVSLRVDRTQSESRADRDLQRGDRDRERDSRHQSDPDADIKILALNAVMRQNPGQAMPLVRGILTGDQPMSVKQHALFALSQSKSPEADALIHDLIVGKMGPELQLQAIQSSGMYRGRANNDSLAEAYRNTTDPKVKRAVISAYFISNDDTHLVELARQEKDMELKRRIVSQLSLMRGKAATDYMMELLK
jgi:hypothetical protein